MSPLGQVLFQLDILQCFADLCVMGAGVYDIGCVPSRIRFAFREM